MFINFYAILFIFFILYNCKKFEKKNKIKSKIKIQKITKINHDFNHLWNFFIAVTGTF